MNKNTGNRNILLSPYPYLQVNDPHFQTSQTEALLIIWLAPWVGKMNWILRCDWQLEWARWSYLACSLYRLCHTRKFIRFWCFIPYNKSFIDQACLVNTAGYWPHSFFMCLWTLTMSRSINTQKKNLANPAILTSCLVNNPYICRNNWKLLFQCNSDNIQYVYMYRPS